MPKFRKKYLCIAGGTRLNFSPNETGDFFVLN